LDNTDCTTLLHLLADARELDKSDVTKLFLTMLSYSNGSNAVLDDDVFVILAVPNLHDGSRTSACAIGIAVSTPLAARDGHVSPASPGARYAEIAEPAVRRHAIVALHGPRQPNVPIQPAMARPISSGESSWT